jgi:hypothetical protein
MLLYSGLEESLRSLQQRIHLFQLDNIVVPAMLTVVNPYAAQLFQNYTHIQPNSVIPIPGLPHITHPYGPPTPRSTDRFHSETEKFIRLLRQAKERSTGSTSRHNPLLNSYDSNPPRGEQGRHRRPTSEALRHRSPLDARYNDHAQNNQQDQYVDIKPIMNYNFHENYVYQQWLQFQTVYIQVYNFTASATEIEASSKSTLTLPDASDSRHNRLHQKSEVPLFETRPSSQTPGPFETNLAAKTTQSRHIPGQIFATPTSIEYDTYDWLRAFNCYEQRTIKVNLTQFAFSPQLLKEYRISVDEKYIQQYEQFKVCF